jgi:uncharacterized protein (DUF427 family)
MTTTREPKIPGADHPITIEPTGVRVTVLAGTQVIADTTRALTLREANYPPVQYIPLEDVDQMLLTANTTRTYCPYKGDASYYSITTGGLRADAVWSYRAPYDAVAEIAGHVAFYTDQVDVVMGGLTADGTAVATAQAATRPASQPASQPKVTT